MLTVQWLTTKRDSVIKEKSAIRQPTRFYTSIVFVILQQYSSQWLHTYRYIILHLICYRCVLGITHAHVTEDSFTGFIENGFIPGSRKAEKLTGRTAADIDSKILRRIQVAAKRQAKLEKQKRFRQAQVRLLYKYLRGSPSTNLKYLLKHH